MKTYRVEDITACFGLFLDEEYEGNDTAEIKEEILNEIIDNIGNYIDIELEEVYENEDMEDEE